MSTDDCHVRYSIDATRVLGTVIVIFWHVCSDCKYTLHPHRKAIVCKVQQEYPGKKTSVFEHYYR